MLAVLPVADLMWSAAFHGFGTTGFAVVAAVLLVETPLLRWLLRTPWDDTAGAVFLGHVAALLAAIVVGIGFTDAVRGFEPGTMRGWSGLAALPGTVLGVLWTGSLEVLSWPSSGKMALFAALGFTCLTFLVSARAVLQVPWSVRSTSAILGVSLFTALGIGVSILWTSRTPEPVETARTLPNDLEITSEIGRDRNLPFAYTARAPRPALVPLLGVDMAKYVRDLLREKGSAVYWVTPESSVYVAIEQMAERGVGALLVMDGARLEGIVSERDYARRVILRGRSSKETLVKEIMTAEVVCVTTERTTEECMALMTNRRIRHLPVIEESQVIGVISIGDVVRAAIDERDFHIQQLESYIATG